MALLALAVLQASAIAALAAPSAIQGEEVHCIRGEAHIVRFDVAGEPGDGSSLDHVERANVRIEPAPQHAGHCRSQLGDGFSPDVDVPVCWGVNEGGECNGAHRVLPLSKGVNCSNCYVAGSMLAHAHLTIAESKPMSFGLGFEYLGLSAGVEINWFGDQVMAEGTYPLPFSGVHADLLNMTVACPICIPLRMGVMVNSSLDYRITADSKNASFRAGVEQNIQFGNALVTWDRVNGWGHEFFHMPTSSNTPLLSDDSQGAGVVEAFLNTSVTLDMHGLGFIRLDVTPKVFGEISESTTAKGESSTCLEAGATFSVTREAQLSYLGTTTTQPAFEVYPQVNATIGKTCVVHNVSNALSSAESFVV